jgi:hypothetical protein
VTVTATSAAGVAVIRFDTARSPKPSAERMQTSPSTIAREALRQLAARRLPPTPDNYTRVYLEIAAPRR